MSHSVQPNGGEAAKLALCGSHPQARRAPFVEDAAPFRQGEKPLCKLLQEPNISSI